MTKKDNSVTLSTKTIFGVTLTSSVINRTFTQSIEICNTRILKNVGLVHLQQENTLKNQKSGSNILDTLAKPNTQLYKEIASIYKKEGIKGYFRGLSTGLGLSLTRAGVFFPLYEYCNHNFI